jgi:hypothetical protein
VKIGFGNYANAKTHSVIDRPITHPLVSASHSATTISQIKRPGESRMLSLQEISDKLEIQQLMTDYAEALDTLQIDKMDNVFTPDAYIDYRAMGGIDGKYPEVREWLKASLKNFSNYYHMIGNVSIKVTGDTATSKIVCFNPMGVPMPDGSTQMMFLGLWYVDEHVRTPQGWRISKRVEHECYQYNVPEHIKVIS